MKNKTYSFSPPVLAAVMAGLVAVPSAAASLEPGWLEVHLLNRQTGQPVSGASVCLGTSARLDQFGARRSDSAGVVRFDDVSPHPLVLTISGDGYQGRRQALEPLYESRVLVVKLANGGGGPRCDAPQQSSASASAAALAVGAVRIADDPDAGAGALLVETQVSGAANQIRISQRPDFGDTDWQPYKPAVAFTPAAAPVGGQLYIQVRRVAQVQGASIEVLSPVKKVAYRRK